MELIDLLLSPKQYDAYELLNDNIHTEVFYGGAAGEVVNLGSAAYGSH